MNFNITFVLMLQILHKVLAIIIALIVLISSLSFTVPRKAHLIEVTDVTYCNVAHTCTITVDQCDIKKPF